MEIEQTVHCSNSFVALFVPMIPFVAKGLFGCMVLGQGYRMLAARRVAAAVRKQRSLKFRDEVVHKMLAVVIVSRLCSLNCLLQIVLVVEKGQSVLVESGA